MEHIDLQIASAATFRDAAVKARANKSVRTFLQARPQLRNYSVPPGSGWKGIISARSRWNQG